MLSDDSLQNAIPSSYSATGETAANVVDIPPDEQINAAITLTKAGDHTQAIVLLSQIIALPTISPESLTCALAWRAQTYEKQRDYASALRDHSAILATTGAPASRVARANYGRARTSIKSTHCETALDDRERLSNAIEDYTRVIDMADASSPASGAPILRQLALLQRAMLRMALHDPQGALADCRQLRQSAKLPLSLRLRAWSLGMLLRIGAPLLSLKRGQPGGLGQ